MQCNKCIHYKHERTHNGRFRPVCHKGRVPYVDTQCHNFKRINISKKIINYALS